MKRLMVVAAGTLALMSGAAYAGDSGCAYDKHLANQEMKSPVLAAVDEAEALRLEKLKALELQASLDAVKDTPVVHN